MVAARSSIVKYQVVAALGDSITAGVGARANSVLDIFTEYRFFLLCFNVM